MQKLLKYIGILTLTVAFVVPSIAQAALTDNLVEYWKLDEASGDRTGAYAGIVFTDVNTVLSGTGVINNGADFESTNEEYFSSTNASLRFSSSMSYQYWVKVESSQTRHLLFNTFTSTGGNKGLIMGLEGTNRNPRFAEYHSGGNSDQVWAVTIPLSTLTHIVFVYDKTAGSVELFVNGASQGTKTGYTTGTIDTSMSTAYLGIDGNLGAGNYMDGIIDEFGIWSRKLTSTEVTQLYNSGAGFAYPFSTSVPSFGDLVITGDW